VSLEETSNSLRAIALRIGWVYRECRLEGFTRSEIDVLSFLRDEHKATRIRMTRELGMSSQATKHALSTLERKGLVLYEHSVETHRVLFFLTELGRDVAREIATRWRTVYAELLQTLEVKEQLRVGEAMVTLVKILKPGAK
jgi:DNA-binding MarR family transcriptional regulator